MQIKIEVKHTEMFFSAFMFCLFLYIFTYCVQNIHIMGVFCDFSLKSVFISNLGSQWIPCLDVGMTP